MVRTETSSSAASCPAVRRPVVCRSSRIETRRLARMVPLCGFPLTGDVSGAALGSGHDLHRDGTAGGPMSAADFDFFHGSWHIEHRRLKSWLTGCTDWEEFGSDTECRPILGGAGNIDEGFIAASGYHHATIRLYEPDTDEWELNWFTSKGGSEI